MSNYKLSKTQSQISGKSVSAGWQCLSQFMASDLNADSFRASTPKTNISIDRPEYKSGFLEGADYK
jgi:hypothetical protein